MKSEFLIQNVFSFKLNFCFFQEVSTALYNLFRIEYIGSIYFHNIGIDFMNTAESSFSIRKSQYIEIIN